MGEAGGAHEALPMRAQRTLFGWMILLAWLSACASAALPQPDHAGDFHPRTLQRDWAVVDTDPAGLNGRLATNFPQNWEDPRETWPSSEVLQWPVVASFAPGSRLKAVHGNLGAIFLQDRSGRSWLMVFRPDGRGVCFVRANARFIRPVPDHPGEQP